MNDQSVSHFEDLPDFLTVEEAASVLRLGRSAAYELTARWRSTNGTEGLPVVQLGRSLRVPKAGLERMMHVDLAARAAAPVEAHSAS